VHQHVEVYSRNSCKNVPDFELFTEREQYRQAFFSNQRLDVPTVSESDKSSQAIRIVNPEQKFDFTQMFSVHIIT
jgi:hypothetical protein